MLAFFISWLTTFSCGVENLAPEIVISLFSLVALLFCCYIKFFRENICYFIAIICVVAVSLLCNRIGSVPGSIGNVMVFNDFTNVFKIILLSSFIFNILHISIVKKTQENYPFEIPILLSFSIVGMMFAIDSNDFLLLYLGLELMSLPLYVAVAYGKDPKNNEAGLKFFILGALSSALYLFGVSMIYGFTQSTHFSIVGDYYVDLVNAIEVDLKIPIAFLIALVLITVSLFFKISAAPFHMWTPDVYQGSSTLVTMFLASSSKIAAVVILMNVLCIAFVDLIDQWKQITMLCAVLSLLVGSLGGLFQKNIKRLLSYSAINHIGFILIAISMDTFYGVASGIIYIVFYVMVNLLIFSCILNLEQNKNYHNNMFDLAGLAGSHKILSFAIMIGMLSMAGIPPFAGFFAKFYVITSIMQQELYHLAIFVVATSVVSCYYYLRIIKVIYFDPINYELDRNKIPVLIKLMLLFVVVFNLGYALIADQMFLIIEQFIHSLISD